MPSVEVREIAEALYQARSAQDALKIKGMHGSAKVCLSYLERALSVLLTEWGFDPGKTALDADQLKLASMRHMVGDMGGVQKNAEILRLQGELEQRTAELRKAENALETAHRDIERLRAQGRDTRTGDAPCPIEDALVEAAGVTGSDDPFRELGRFQEFCMRSRYHGLVGEDPTLPVRPWVEARGHRSLVDLREAVRLYVEWQREACHLFLQQRGMTPPVDSA